MSTRPAIADTHPQGGNSPKSEVPFMSGAVTRARAAIAQISLRAGLCLSLWRRKRMRKAGFVRLYRRRA